MLCKKCGREIIPGKRFCGGCGAPVEQAPQQMPQAPAQNQYAPVQNRNAPAQQENKDNKTKKTVAIILVIVIVFISCAIGFAVIYSPIGFTVIYNKKKDKSDEEALRKAVDDYTTKQLLEFYYDDYDADGNKEAFAIAGDGDKDNFKKADIIYVERKKKPKTVDSNIDGHTNGIIHDGKSKFISVEKEAEKAKDNRSYVYGVKDEKAYQPEVSGKYQNVRQDGKDIVAEDPETRKKIVLTIGDDGEFITEKSDNDSAGTPADQQNTADQTVTSSDQKNEDASNNPKPSSQDFKKLENILNWDGGEIEDRDSVYFNYKTASQKEIVEIANSFGFVPAYRAYFDEDIFDHYKQLDTDDDGGSDMNIPVKAFNWILKNVYNYNGEEVSKNNSFGYNVIGDEIFFGLPLDEGGVYGKFEYKNYTVNDNVYKVKFDYYNNIADYGESPEYEFDSVYTVTAAFKTVRDADNKADINVWSIYSIERS